MAPKKEISPEAQEIDRRHTRTTYRATFLGAVSSIFAIVGVLAPGVWWFAEPRLVGALAQTMAPAIDARVDDRIEGKLAPLSAGFKAILSQNINRLLREIAELERRDRQAGLSAEEMRLLTDKRIELKGQQEALAAIERAESAEPARRSE